MDPQFDLRYTFRLLRKDPGFTSICLLVIVLGVATSLIAYSYVNALFFKAPPFPDGNDFVVINSIDTTTGFVQPFVLNGYGYNLLQESQNSFSELGAFQDQFTILSDRESAQTSRSTRLTPNLLAMTEQQPQLGRILTSADAKEGAAATVLIGYQLWQNYYAGDPNIVGSSSRIDGELYTVIGVMPEAFNYPFLSELWMPLDIPASSAADDTSRLGLIALIEEEASISQANSEVNQVFAQMAQDYPDRFQKFSANVSPYVRLYSANTLIGPWVGIALVILALACVNLGSLLLLRSNARHQELVVRSAVGAGRWQLGKQVLLESFFLCCTGTVIAVLISNVFLDIQQDLSAVGELYDLRLDGNAVIAAVVITIITWLLAGSFAAFRASSKRPGMIMDGGNKGGSSRSSSLLTNGIVGVEITLSCFLLVLCILLAVGVFRLYSIDLGTATDNYSAGQLNLSTQTYDQARSRELYLNELESELLSDSAVNAVAYATLLPGQFPQPIAYDLADVDVRSDAGYPRQAVSWTSNNYFQLMQVDLVEGRQFDSSDTADSQLVAIIDELFANTRWPGESVIGKQIQLNPELEGEWLTVVGVVSHITQMIPGLPDTLFYRPLSQNTPSSFWVLANTVAGVSTGNVESAIRQAAVRVDRDIPVENISTLKERQQAWITDTGADVFGPLSISLALITLVLAIVGIYGVVSRSVSSRTSEIGVRRALGSSNHNVISLFLKQGSKYLLLGVVIGGGGAALAGNTMSRLFPELVASLPLVLLFVTVVLGLLVAIASYVPAKNAVALEPGEALHYE